MVAGAKELAEADAERLRAAAIAELRESLGAELARLRALANRGQVIEVNACAACDAA